MPLRFVALALALFLAACQSAESPKPNALAYAAAAQTTGDPRYAAIVVDAASGRVLHEDNAELLRHPASLAKMMTLYLLFEELRRGALSLETPLPISANAARQPPSKLGLKAGSSILVADAILGLAVKSGNDVAVVVAEAIAGSEAAFAQRMTRTAQVLRMERTIFANASGLPDPGMVTTARDMAILARALQNDFPERYALSMRSFKYNGRLYRSTNTLLGEVPGMDGIKTGYIRASGFNLATSVKRGGRRVIVVVMGGKTGAARNARVAQLVDEYLPGSEGWMAWRD